ncbi:MAG: hypothetical protein EXR79_02685 [Myxococcales bacterium]|nr:hypothetical protein [Myxococcales bacterium]
MLTTLRIADFAILQAAEVTFGPGLNALTGETGAGKSIVLHALDAALGGKATDKIVRHGAARAEVEALFEAPWPAAVDELLAEMGAESDDGTLVLRRTVAAGGKSRAWANGRLVPVAQQRALGRLLCDVSAQHAAHRMLEPAAQRDALDRFAGLQGERAALAALHRNWTDQRAALAAVDARDRARADRLDWLRFVHKELEDLGLKAGELADIEARLLRLRAADRIARALQEAHGGLDGDGGAAATLHKAGRSLQKLAGAGRDIEEFAVRCRELHDLARDLAHDLAVAARAVHKDDRELGRLSERQDQLQRALKKHGGSEAAALTKLIDITAELDADADEQRRAELEHRLAALQKSLDAHATRLSDARHAAAGPLGQQVSALLHDLGMPAAELRTDVLTADGADSGPTGRDTVTLWLRANRGEAGGALQAVASGGELARVLLAVQRACAGRDGPAAGVATGAAGTELAAPPDAAPVAVFDEVDAGLSGSVGLKLGRFLRGIAAQQQVIVVSHLPQVAAAANVHLQACKAEAAGRTRSVIASLDVPGRERELARMLGEAGQGETALQHARELIAAQRDSQSGDTTIAAM